MIDEQVLERALRAEADAYPPPVDGPDAIRAAAAPAGGSVDSAGSGRTRRAVFALAAAAALVVAVVAIPRSGGLSPASRPQMALENSYDGYAYQNDGGGSTGGSNAGSAGNKLTEQQQGGDVVRTGEVTVEVDDVPRATATLAGIASARGGFVAASSTGGAPGEQSGSVTLRVPAPAFDAAVAEAGRVGRVVSSGTTGEDVSAQVTDVAARLKSQTATRAQLQALLARAKDVGEVLAVQQRLTETQTEIERLQAQQASLKDRTAFGTLTVHVHEEGAFEDERSGFGKAWHDAVDGFVSAAQAVVAASGTIAFVLLVLALLALALRPVYRVLVRRIV